MILKIVMPLQEPKSRKISRGAQTNKASLGRGICQFYGAHQYPRKHRRPHDPAGTIKIRTLVAEGGRKRERERESGKESRWLHGEGD